MLASVRQTLALRLEIRHQRNNTEARVRVQGDGQIDGHGTRCGWVNQVDALYCAYHDTEWGVPVLDSRALWELSVLESFQAGLAWITILRKREAFRVAFGGFDPHQVSAFTEADVTRLLGDAGIVRSRAKIEAAVASARVWCAMEARGESFSALVWDVVDGRPIQNAWRSFRDAPVATPASERLSGRLKEKGWKFFGPVIAYAFMQAAGLVNDHEVGCPRHAPVRAIGEAL
ncbi:MAG: DNA-3-methyladenine glycosylase I [Hyphomonadaceae bacterium]|jgi:DNA-3-methyladenine glycosylase I|nr:DNA-3-methyladenine glycosylase I [Hyphomonadaceae bacterium]